MPRVSKLHLPVIAHYLTKNGDTVTPKLLYAICRILVNECHKAASVLEFLETRGLHADIAENGALVVKGPGHLSSEDLDAFIRMMGLDSVTIMYEVEDTATQVKSTARKSTRSRVVTKQRSITKSYKPANACRKHGGN
jgi:hypothetical protein